MAEYLATFHVDLPDYAAILALLLAAWMAYFLSSQVLLVALRSLARRTTASMSLHTSTRPNRKPMAASN